MDSVSLQQNRHLQHQPDLHAGRRLQSLVHAPSELSALRGRLERHDHRHVLVRKRRMDDERLQRRRGAMNHGNTLRNRNDNGRRQRPCNSLQLRWLRCRSWRHPRRLLMQKTIFNFFQKTLDFYLILHYTGTIIVTGQCIYNQVIFYYGGIYHDNSQPEFRTE